MRRILVILLIFLVSAYAFAEQKPAKNILIVYGSFAGSTREIAEKMKGILEGMRCRVGLMPASDRDADLSTYDIVVIGSAIRAGKPHPDVLKFVKKNREGLRLKKTAVFIVCISIISEKPEKRARAGHYPEKLTLGFTPASKAVFAGVVKDSGWFANWMIKREFGDYRDWKKIEAWTRSLPGLI